MKTGWSNYHTHSLFCDGRMTPEEAVDRAIINNVKILGFSSHAPVPFFTKWTMKANRLLDYMTIIDDLKTRYAHQITILKSLEIDYIPNTIHPHSFNLYKLDYTIGSVHFVDEYNDGMPWSFDGNIDEFKRGLKEIFNNDIQACVKRYFALVREMLKLHPPTILGHFDKIRMHNNSLNLFNESDEWYQIEIDHTLEAIKRSGVIVEINTKSFDRGMLIFPNLKLVEKMAKLNIPLTINSDCHHLEKMTVGYSYVANELIKNGISDTWQFINHQWLPMPLTPNGVRFENTLLTI